MTKTIDDVPSCGQENDYRRAAPQSSPVSETLKPCPFCGENYASLNDPNEFDRYGSINCPACLVVMPGACSDRNELIRMWNSRTSDLAQTPAVPEGYAVLPLKLTAENGAKAALIGEFHEDFGLLDESGDERYIKVAVTWDTIKRIWDAAVQHFAVSHSSTIRHGACQVCGEVADLKCGPSRFGAETWACSDCWEPGTSTNCESDNG
jgi:hypothetical protein